MTEDNEALHGIIHPMLWKIATSQAIGELAELVLRMRASKAEERSAVNSTMIVEVAAEHRPPAEIAELVRQFHRQRPAGDLARLALDAAAARRETEVLAELAAELVSRDLAVAARTLLSCVVRRRLPRDIAWLLSNLDTAGHDELAIILVDELAHDDGRVLVVLWLRALDRADLAEQVSWRMGRILNPVDLAGFIGGLNAYREGSSADSAVRSALGRDLAELAKAIESLHHGRADLHTDVGSHAAGFVRIAASELAPDDLCVLASLLSAGSWQEGAELVLAEIVADTEGAELVDNLKKSMDRSGNPAGVLDALRKAAETHPIERVAVLAVEVEGKIEPVVDGRMRRGYDTVLDTVATSRSVADAFTMAEELDNRGYGRVSDDLIGRLERTIDQRRDGADIAEFIDQMLTRVGSEQQRALSRFRRPRREGAAAIIDSVARRRDPEQLMGVIAELTRRRRYSSCHRWVEHSVAEHYGGTLLATLPLVRRRDYLPAVLEIVLTALRTPKWTQPREIPNIVLALQEAGISSRNLYELLSYTGGKRDLDFDEIVAALERRNLTTEAKWVLEGKRRPPEVPHFLT